MFRDLTEQRRVEATLREGTELMSRLRDANVLGVAVADEDRFFDANDAFLDIIGFSRDDLEAGRLSDRSVTAPECADSDAGALEQLRRTGAVRPYEKEYIHRDSHRVPVLAGAAVVGRNPLRWVTFAVDLSARQRAEKERAELLSRERAALAEAASAEERLTFMLRGGDLVAATRDRHELLQHASRLVVDSLADFCCFDAVLAHASRSPRLRSDTPRDAWPHPAHHSASGCYRALARLFPVGPDAGRASGSGLRCVPGGPIRCHRPSGRCPRGTWRYG